MRAPIELFREAEELLKTTLNMSLVEIEGEYRVAFRETDGTDLGEEEAYYTPDLQDAVRTAMVMRSVRRLRSMRNKTRNGGNGKRPKRS